MKTILKLERLKSMFGVRLLDERDKLMASVKNEEREVVLWRDERCAKTGESLREVTRELCEDMKLDPTKTDLVVEGDKAILEVKVSDEETQAHDVEPIYVKIVVGMWREYREAKERADEKERSLTKLRGLLEEADGKLSRWAAKVASDKGYEGTPSVQRDPKDASSVVLVFGA